MKRLVLLTILQVILTQTFCQTQSDDFIKKTEQRLHTHKRDNGYVDLLNELALVCYAAHPEKTKTYSKLALDLADSLHYIKGLADSYSSSSLIYKLKGEYSNELALDLEALKIYQSLKDSLLVARTYNAIGVIHYQMKDYKTSAELHDKALAIFKSLHNEKGIAETSLKKGNVYMELRDLTKGIEAYEMALKTEQVMKNELGISNALNNLGIAYYELNEFNKALEYYNESQRLIIKINNLNRLPASYHNIARVYLKQGRLSDALALAKKDFYLSQKLNIRPAIMEATKLLSEIYRAMKNYELSMEYSDQYHKVKDSVENIQNSLQFARLQSIYRLEEKEKEIDLLRKDQQLARLMQQALWFGIIGVVIISGLIVYDQRGRIKRNQEIIKKNSELHQAQTALAESEIQNKQLIEKELRQDLEFRHKELLIYTLNLVQKNTLMEEMRGGIQEVLSSTDKDSKIKLNRLIKLIDYSLETEKDWDEFKMYFEKVHSSFFENLKSTFPDLTQSDLKLCALISLNLSMKEMAELLGISPESVKMARHRLRKKLNIETESNLSDFLNNFKESENQNLTKL